jgi:hypothetical protein
MVLRTFHVYRTSFAPETISPERNEHDQSNENAAKSTIASFIQSLITVWLQVRVLPGPPTRLAALPALFPPHQMACERSNRLG